MTQLEDLLHPYGNLITSHIVEKNAGQLFKDHPEMPILIDAINRKYTHHALIKTNLSERCLLHFFEALHAKLRNQNTKRSFMMWQLDAEEIVEHSALQEKILSYIYAESNQATLIFCIHLPNQKSRPTSITDYLQHPFIRKLNAHPACRIFVSTERHDILPRFLQENYIEVTLPELYPSDIFNILKLERIILEKHHRVVIPDEVLMQTFSLAKQYLSIRDSVEKAILLLDSTAARIQQESASTQSSAPILNLHAVTAVLSSWIKIPATQLIAQHFNAKEFTRHLQQNIDASELIANQLQHHNIFLNKPKHTLTHFLFAGCLHSGKNAAIESLAQYFYKQTNMIYYVDSLHSCDSLLKLPLKKISCYSPLTLKALIEQKPYAIIVFENIEEADASLYEELQQLLTTNHIEDQNQTHYSFQQACIIFTTTLGTEHLHKAAHQTNFAAEQTSNLMQLIMNEKKSQDSITAPDALIKLIRDELSQKLPISLCKQFSIIPFLPANKATIEKIIQAKLKILSHRLQDQHSVIFHHAPEVIRYLTRRAMEHQAASRDFHIIIEEVDHCIEQALQRPRRQEHPNELFLQLNETGEVLRSNWIATTETHGVN